MKNNSFERNQLRNACVRDIYQESEARENALLIYTCLKNEGVRFFSESTMCHGGCRVVYEMFIYYLVQEDYEKCAVIRKILDEHHRQQFNEKYAFPDTI